MNDELAFFFTKALFREYYQRIDLMASEYIHFTSFTSIWFWFFLGVFWYFECNSIFGVQYSAWYEAKNNNEELSELSKVTRFLASRFVKKYQLTKHWISILLLAFLSSFWASTAIIYGSEFLQALFFVFLPIPTLSLIRFNLANKLLGQNLSPSELFLQIRLHRRNSQLLAVFTLSIIFCWVIFTMLKHQTIWN
jgi:hypothetical protein